MKGIIEWKLDVKKHNVKHVDENRKSPLFYYLKGHKIYFIVVFLLKINSF